MEYQFESIGPALRWVVLAFLIVAVVVAVAVAAGVAALPGWVARRRNHPQAMAINICGWFGLPTGVMWVVAMVWAFVEQSGQAGAVASNLEVEKLKDDINKLDSLVKSLEEASA